jgi:hypothetical protein
MILAGAIMAQIASFAARSALPQNIYQTGRVSFGDRVTGSRYGLNL